MTPIDVARDRRIISRLVAVAVFAAASIAPAAAASSVSLELNRLETRDNACGISLVVGNPGDKPYDSLKLDLVFFDKEGVIGKRLAVEAGPIRASKTTVKLFNVTDTPCENVSRVLLNDVTACGGEQDCLGLVTTTSRVKGVEFGK